MQLFAHIDPGNPRSPQQPLESSREQDIHSEFLHRQGEDTRRLIGIDDEECADLLYFVRESRQIVGPPGGEEDMAHGQKSGLFGQQVIPGIVGNPDPVGAAGQHHFDPVTGPGQPLIGHGRKIEFGADHPVAAAVIDRRGHRREPARDIGYDCDFVGAAVQQAGDCGAQALDLTQPELVPRRSAHCLPQVEEGFDPFAAAPAQGPQRAGVEIGRGFENGKLLAESRPHGDLSFPKT